MERSDHSNIGDAERRLRLYTGVGAAIVGVLCTVFLLSEPIHPAWRGLLFVPYWLAALGVLQYREGI